MSDINLAGTLPDPADNGLYAILQLLRTHPEQTHVCVAVIDAKHVKRETDTGILTPTVRIRQIEVVTGSDGDQATAMLERALGARGGQMTLAGASGDDD